MTWFSFHVILYVTVRNGIVTYFYAMHTDAQRRYAAKAVRVWRTGRGRSFPDSNVHYK